MRSAKILECEIEDSAGQRLAECSRQTPRIANRLLRRARDFAEYKSGQKSIKRDMVYKTLESLGIDALGLDSMDRNTLETMTDKFKGGPVD